MTEADAGRPATPVRPLAVALGAALGALAAAFSFQRIRSFDYWWHLRTGELIAAEGAVPRVDPFSFSVEGARWIDVHWLHQLALHAQYELGGHGAVVFGEFALVAIALGCLALAIRRWDRPGVVVFALALGLVTLSDRIMPRPELPTFALLAAELALLERFRRKPDAAVYGVVGLQWVWANLHGLFAVGLGVVAMAFVGEALDAVRAGRLAAARPRLARLAAVGAGSSAVTLLNPNGLDAALYPIQQLFMIGSPEMRATVGLSSVELGTLLGNWRLLDRSVLGAFGALALLSLLALGLNWRRARAFDVLLLAVFGALGGLALRNIALFGVAAPLVLARNAAEWLDPRRGLAPRLAGPAAASLVCLVLGLALAVGSGRWALWTASVREPGFGIMGRLYPVGATEWIARELPPGPIYHHMADGGYLIWRLYPTYRVLADGRLEVYGDRMAALSGTSPAAFRKLDGEYAFGIALLSYNHFDFGDLLAMLHASRAWRLAYVDDTAVVFVRRRPGAGPQPDLDTAAPTLFPALGDERSIADLLARQGRMRFYGALGRSYEQRRYEADIVRRYPAFVR